MEKGFIPYEESLALKELGFDEPCLAKYQKLAEFANYQLQLLQKERNCNRLDTAISAPLYQQAFRWFREKYKLHSYIIDSKSYNWYFNIDDMIKDDVISEVLYFNTYEEAESACLRKLIEIVKNK